MDVPADVARLPRPSWPPSRPVATYVGLVGVLVGARAVFSFVPPDAPLSSQASALSWGAVVVIALAGAVGFALARQTAIAGPGAGVGRLAAAPTGGRLLVVARRYLEPTLVGLAAAAALVALDRAVPLGIPHVPPPLSVPFYLYGAVATEIVLRLVPLGVAVWLVSRVRSGRPWQAGTFLVVAAATALVEPVGLVDVVAPAGRWVVGAVAGIAYALNLAAAYLFWRLGFLAAVVERTVFYLVWHVVYGGLV